MTRRVTLLALALMLLAGCTHHTATTTPTAAPTTTLANVAADRPRANLTPGVILTTNKTDVCTPGWSGQHRHSLSAEQKTAVLRAYGYPTSIKVAEMDHLVSLELGGDNGRSNIWPMISRADAARKDRLENALHRQVCTGGLPLAVAQTRIKEYWRWW